MHDFIVLWTFSRHRSFTRMLYFISVIVSFRFIFVWVVISYDCTSCAVTHCFHSLTYNVHKVLILSRRYSWYCFSLWSSSSSAFLFLILLAMATIWYAGMWLEFESSRRWGYIIFLVLVLDIWYSPWSFINEHLTSTDCTEKPPRRGTILNFACAHEIHNRCYCRMALQKLSMIWYSTIQLARFYWETIAWKSEWTG